MMTRHLTVLTAYFILTILMTWPTASHLTTGIPGDGFDGWQNYWNLWWVKQALLVEATNPYFTDYLYAPTGVSLLFHTLNIFNGLWTLPLQLNFGLAVAYNSVVFLSFVLAGYGGYLLSLYSLNRLDVAPGPAIHPAAFVGGLVFTMSPFHLAHLLGHMQVFSLIWPPFYVLWLGRTLGLFETSAGKPHRKQAINLFLGSLFLILATLVDWYHTLYLLIFTALTLGWNIGRTWPHLKLAGQSVIQVAVIGLLFIVIMSPLLGPMMQQANQRPDLETGLEQNIALSADLLAFVTPSEMHPLWGEWATTIANTFTSTTSERLIFAGFGPLILAGFIILTAWSQSVVKFWSFITGSFFVLALGPYLHIAGQIVTLGGWPLPLPYLLLYHTVPFIGLTRSLSRYDLMVMLGLGVLVALALGKLTNRLQNRPSWQVWLIAGVLPTILICLEFLPIPYPISKIDTPQFFHTISQEPADYTIAALPMNWDRPTPLLYQTVHGKPLLTAYTSRNNPLELAWRVPVLQQWRHLSRDIIDLPLADIAPTIFYDFNLRYIVVDYWQMPPGPEREATEQWLQVALPTATPVYNDSRLRVYQTPAKEMTLPYLSLGDKWRQPYPVADGVARDWPQPASEPPALVLHHPPAASLTLELTARSEARPTEVSLMVNGEMVGEPFLLTPIFTTHRLILPRLTVELAKLQFEVAEPIPKISMSRVTLIHD